MNVRMIGLAAAGAALLSCSVPPQKKTADIVEPLLEELRETEADDTPPVPADRVARPVIGEPAPEPLVVERIDGVELSLEEAVRYMLPDWEFEVLLAHPNDPAPKVNERRKVVFYGGTIEKYLAALSLIWNVDVTMPYVGKVSLATRSLESWLVTHWMEPPMGAGGGGSVGGSNQQGFNQGSDFQQQDAGNQQSGFGGGVGGYAGAAQGAPVVAEAGEGLEMLVEQLRKLVVNESGGDEGEGAVWLNKEVGLLHVWAPPRERAGMRPLLMEYGARRVAADPELLSTMIRGHFRVRLVLVRFSGNRERSAGLQWEESLQALLPSGSILGGIPASGFGGNVLSDSLSVSRSVTVGGSGAAIGAGGEFEQGSPTFPTRSRFDLLSQIDEQEAMQRAIEIDRDRTEADLERINARIDALRAENVDGSDGSVARELRTLEIQSEKMTAEVQGLTRELGLAGLRAARAQSWLDRVTESNERGWRRSLGLVVALGSVHGETNVSQKISIDARHGRPINLQIGTERIFIGEINETISQGLSQTGARPETRLEGLSLVMRPWLEGRRCVRIGVALSNSGVTSIASFNVGGNELAIPQMAIQTWASERRLCDAQPAVLARFKIETRNSSQGGLPVPFGREVTLQRSGMGNSEEYLLLLQVLPPPSWGLAS